MKKNIIIVCCFLVGLTVALTPLSRLEGEFLKFQKKYNKIYETQEEFDKRFEIFKANVDRAVALQRKEKTGGARFGVTKFMDLTPEEFGNFFRMPKANFANMTIAPSKTHFETRKVSPNPTNWDWCLNAGSCTPIYNQGQCGSCWAFSVVETIESYYIIEGNPVTELSMEEIVDCDTQDQGCGGGFPTTAYEYVQQCGLESYSSYPYSGEGTACQYNAADVIVGISGFQSIDGETGLYQQLSTAGPVSVCVDASSWQTYNGGVLSSCGTNVDHCVELTGYYNYGTSNAYWNVRNSWGADWGENGFIWVAIGQNLCDIGSYATVPDVTSPPTDPPSTCSQ